MEEDKDDWNQKKSICYVFSDVFSRTPNQEFAQNVLAKLYSSNVLDKKNVEETAERVLLGSSKVSYSNCELKVIAISNLILSNFLVG